MIIKKILARIRNDCPIEKLVKMGLKLGKNYSIARNAEIDYSHCWLIEIGDNVTITSKCIILAHDASMNKNLGYTKIGKVVIKDNVFIGVNSVVLPGVTIGENSIIGSGSVVTHDVEPNSVYVGNPARKISTKQEFINKHKKAINNKPIFDETYTIRKNISQDKKLEMLEKLKDKTGYVK